MPPCCFSAIAGNVRLRVCIQSSCRRVGCLQRNFSLGEPSGARMPCALSLPSVPPPSALASHAVTCEVGWLAIGGGVADWVDVAWRRGQSVYGVWWVHARWEGCSGVAVSGARRAAQWWAVATLAAVHMMEVARHCMHGRVGARRVPHGAMTSYERAHECESLTSPVLLLRHGRERSTPRLHSIKLSASGTSPA